MYQENDYKKAIELIELEKINLDPLISVHFNFKDYLKAYQHIEEKRDKIMKVIINIH
jgi:L-iditol 2-dehydrogenase